MGKGNILSNLGNGKYEVEVVYNTERLDSAIKKLEKEIDKVKYNVIPDLEDTESNAKDKVDSAEADLQNAIENYIADKSEENKKAVDEAQENYVQALGEYQKATIALKDKKMELKSLQKRKDFLQDNYPGNEIKEMWCADYSNHLSGEVGTVEIPGSAQYIQQIVPGYEDDAVFTPDRDGQLFPVVALSPAEAFYNLAMLPGWQKWRPFFRKGTISNVSVVENTADVDLDSEFSNQQDLEVNKQESLTRVPVEYMNCDAVAFREGDKVLVDFVNNKWENPRVVGFVEEPRPCKIYFEISINGVRPSSMRHKLGLFDADTWEKVTEELTDWNGVVAFSLDDISKEYDFSKLKIGLYHEGYDGHKIFDHVLEGEDTPGDLGGEGSWIVTAHLRVRDAHGWDPNDHHHLFEKKAVNPDEDLPLPSSDPDAWFAGQPSGWTSVSDPVYISAFEWKPYVDKTVQELLDNSQEMTTEDGRDVMGGVVDFDGCRVPYITVEQAANPLFGKYGVNVPDDCKEFLTDPNKAYFYPPMYGKRYELSTFDSWGRFPFSWSKYVYKVLSGKYAGRIIDATLYETDWTFEDYWVVELFMTLDKDQIIDPRDIYLFTNSDNTETPSKSKYEINIDAVLTQELGYPEGSVYDWYRPWSKVCVEQISTPEEYI